MNQILGTEYPSFPYTWGYYEQQNPLLIDYVAKLHGVKRPPFGNKFTYCDLGCGNGVTVNTLASAMPQGEFYGIDINNTHIKNASHFAAEGKLNNIQFIESSFAELSKKNLPDFDYITLQGVYSHVSPEVREEISAFLKKKLKPSGLIYINYNTLPGWSELAPFQKFLTLFSPYLTGKDELEKVQNAFGLLNLLIQEKVPIFNNEKAIAYMDFLKKQNMNFAIHELLTPYSDAFYFTDIAKTMRAQDFAYIGSTTLPANYINMMVPQKLIDIIKPVNDPIIAAQFCDFINGTQNRTDIFGRIQTQYAESIEERNDLLNSFFVFSTGGDRKFERTVNLKNLTVNFTEQAETIFEQAKDQGITIAEIREQANLKKDDVQSFITLISQMIATNQLHLSQKPLNNKIIKEAPIKLSPFNQTALDLGLKNNLHLPLSSPLVGGGIELPAGINLALHALALTDKKNRIDRTLEFLDQYKIEMRKDNQLLTSHEDRAEILKGSIEICEKNVLPMLKSYGIIT